MNSVERAHRVVAGPGRVHFAPIGRNQGRLPVVQVEDIWSEVERGDRFEHRAAKEDEPSGVILVIDQGAAGRQLVLVETESGGRVVASKVPRLLDEVHRYFRIRQAAPPQAAADV